MQVFAFNEPPMRHSGFDALYPAVTFGFFVAAVALSVMALQPLYQLAGMTLSLVYYFLLNGRKGIRTVLALLPLYVAVVLINPLFNTRGATVLFTLPWGRPYTLEALVFGTSTAGMLVTVLVWFFCYSKLVTADKFTYLFGGFIPAVTLVFTMVMRLVPTYQRKAVEISSARDCIGRSVTKGSWRERATAGVMLLSALTTWALEGAIDTADSMRSRGYGSGHRSSFARYRYTPRDMAATAGLVIFGVAAFVCLLAGAGQMTFYPVLQLPVATPVNIIGFICYVLFLAAPSIIDITEVALWRVSLSKI